jgi:uncharacterized protein YwqG
VWTSDVADLDLTVSEQERWQLLRADLAARHGVVLADDESPSDATVALHRLFGYPDERLGRMRQACEAAARGIDLGGRPPFEHPRVKEFEAGAGRWLLFFQFSLDQLVGWDWGRGRQRLYVWIDREALRAWDFSRVWAITQ